MFRQLAKLMTTPESVFVVHPLQLSRWLDEAWAAAATVPALGGQVSGHVPFLGSDEIVDAIDLPTPNPVPAGINTLNANVFNGRLPVATRIGLISDHLIYAYLIECTGVFEILAEVLRRYVAGETLPPLTPEAARWARTTEELFFRDPPLYAIQGTVSELRPDQRVARRGAYWRMFGLEPPFPIPRRWARAGSDGAPWRLDTGGGVNTRFRETWVELLRQIWLGFENAKNGIGPNATDSEHIGLLCQCLREMMAMRRRHGLLAREEMVYVATLSWFHASVETDASPIVKVLSAQGPDPADRLARIAQHVGMTPTPASRDLFRLAELMSTFLRAAELGLFDSGSAAELLYRDLGTNTAIRTDMNRIIDHWQSATGDRVKERPIGATAQRSRLSQPAGGPPAAAPVPAAPVAAPAPALGATPSADGQHPTAPLGAGPGLG